MSFAFRPVPPAPPWFRPVPPPPGPRKARRRRNPDEEELFKPPPALVEDVKKLILTEKRRKTGRTGHIPEFEPYPSLDLPLGVLYFVSGAHDPGEIRGFADLGLGVGTSAAECGDLDRPKNKRPRITNCEAGYYDLPVMRTPPPAVFVDNGAFTEWSTSDEARKARAAARKKPTAENKKKAEDLEKIAKQAKLTPERTKDVLDFYDRFVRHMSGNHRKIPVFLVAPDKKGDQKETLKRLRKHAPRVTRIRREGARLGNEVVVLTALQRGVDPQSSFFDKIKQIMGRNVVPAIPFAKGATPHPEIERFLVESGGSLQGIHFLGLGPRHKSFPKIHEWVLEYAPQARMSMDSGLGRAAIGWGRTGDPKFEPRAHSYAQQIARILIEGELGLFEEDPRPGHVHYLPGLAELRKKHGDTPSIRGLETMAVWTRSQGWHVFDETEEIGRLKDWLVHEDGTPTAELLEIESDLGHLKEGGLRPQERAHLRKDPDTFLRSPMGGPYGKPGKWPVPKCPRGDPDCTWWDHPYAYESLRQAWWAMVKTQTEVSRVSTKKRYAIHYAFALARAGAITPAEAADLVGLPLGLLLTQMPLFRPVATSQLTMWRWSCP